MSGSLQRAYRVLLEAPLGHIRSSDHGSHFSWRMDIGLARARELVSSELPARHKSVKFRTSLTSNLARVFIESN